MEDLARYTVVHSRTVAVLFVDTRPVDAIAFNHDLLGADDPKSVFPGSGVDAGCSSHTDCLFSGWFPRAMISLTGTLHGLP